MNYNFNRNRQEPPNSRPTPSKLSSAPRYITYLSISNISVVTTVTLQHQSSQFCTIAAFCLLLGSFYFFRYVSFYFRYVYIFFLFIFLVFIFDCFSNIFLYFWIYGNHSATHPSPPRGVTLGTPDLNDA